MLNDLCGTNAFANQLILHHQTVRDYSMRETKGGALGTLLHWTSKPVSFAFRSNTRAHPGEKRSGHAKDVRIEAVRVHDIDLVLFDEVDKAAQLFDEVQIMEAVERV